MQRDSTMFPLPNATDRSLFVADSQTHQGTVGGPICGVITGPAMPTNSAMSSVEGLKIDVFETQRSPEGSIAIAPGVFKPAPTNPVDGESAEPVGLNSVIAELPRFDTHISPRLSALTKMGSANPPTPVTGEKPVSEPAESSITIRLSPTSATHTCCEGSISEKIGCFSTLAA